MNEESEDHGWLGDKFDRLTRKELIQRLADAEAAIMNAQAILPVREKAWWALDDYGDGTMDAIKKVCTQVVRQVVPQVNPELTEAMVGDLVNGLFPRKQHSP